MTALALDLRGPLAVVAGAFNPAIFTTSWIATNIFDIPVGAEMSVLEALVQVDPQTLLRLGFIEGIALNATASRLELFAVNGEASTFDALERALVKLLELLPHTTVGGLGCNFRWIDSDPSPDAIDRFDSAEGLEGKFSVAVRQFSAQVQLDGQVLNLARASIGSEVHYSFNYHRTVTDAAQCASMLQGMLTADLVHSTQMMADLYGYHEHTTLAFGGDDIEEIVDAAENTD